MSFRSFISTNKIELFTGFGISAIIVGFVKGCQNTLKAERVLEEHNEVREVLIKRAEKGEDVRTDTYKLYGYTAARFAGLFAIPVALVAGGVVSCAYATKLSMDESVKLAEKNTALVAALAAGEERFSKYRDRMIEKYGNEADEQLLCPTKEVTVEKETTDDNGKKKKVKEKIEYVDPAEDLNPTTFYITRSNDNFMENDTSMKFWFSAIQDTMDDELNRRRHDGKPTWITVNNVRERMGVEPRKDLQFWGWIKDNFKEDDGTRIVIGYEKKNLRSADGGTEPGWKVTLDTARNIANDIW